MYYSKIKIKFNLCYSLRGMLTILPLLTIQAATANALVPDFTITGAINEGTTFKVNEEILFDASPTTFAEGTYPDRSLTSQGRVSRNGFLWDFGNGNYTAKDYGGISATQIYTKPGIYPVRLDVMDSTGQTVSITKTIKIEGIEPKLAPRAEASAKALEIKFDSQNLIDTSPNAHSAAWIGESSPIYTDGKEGKALNFANGYLRIPAKDTLDGFSNGITISLWIKRSNARDSGYLLHKPGCFYVRTWTDGTQNPLRAAIVNQSAATAAPTNWIFTGDTSWHHIVVVYDKTAETVTLYTDGVIQQAVSKQASVALSGNVATSSDSLFIGSSATGADRWTGLIDEIKIFNRTLSQDEIQYGFETFHGDFHARIRQRIDYHIPSDLTESPTNKLKVTLIGKKGYSNIVYNKIGLSSRESFILNQSELNADTYTLISQVLDGSDKEIERYEEPFAKRYDGIPHIGINENNAICIDGQPYFPVTSFGLNNENIADWTTRRATHPQEYGGTAGSPLLPMINTLNTQSFWPNTYNPATWETYLNLGKSHGNLMAIGPSSWPTGEWSNVSYGGRYCLSSNLKTYLSALKDHKNLLAWSWRDEPDLGGPNENVPSSVVRSWTFLSQRYAPEQLTYSNLCGPKFVYNLKNSGGKDSYSYSGSRGVFGKNTSVADIISYDYYPYDWRISRRNQNCSIAGALSGLEILRNQNPYNPVMAFIETADIRDDAGVLRGNWNRPDMADLTPTIEPNQIKMLAWLHVVLGFKGISWFPYFSDFNPVKNDGGSAKTIIATAGSKTIICPNSNQFSRLHAGRHIRISRGSAGWTTKTIASVTNANTLELTEAWEYPTTSTLWWQIDGRWDNWNAMSEFTQQITELAPVVLGPETNYALTVKPNEGKVRTLVREHDGKIYIIAVRETEMIGPHPNSTIVDGVIPPSGYFTDNGTWIEKGKLGDNVPVSDKTVRFSLDGISGKTITILNENRTITPIDNSFTDSFAECDVHIYVISNQEQSQEKNEPKFSISTPLNGSIITKINDVVTTDTRFDEGTSLELTASPAAGYYFTEWTITTNGVTTSLSANKTITITTDSNKVITANFVQASTTLGQVSHWLLDDYSSTTIADVNNLKTANLINGPVWDSTSQWQGTDWLGFNQSTQAITIPTMGMSPQAGTLAVWVEPKDFSGMKFILGHVLNNANRLSLYTVAGSLAVGLGSNATLKTNITPLSLNQPVHLALSWEGTAYAVYVNGVQKAAGTFSGLTALNTFIDIGNYGDPAFRSLGFAGKIDDIRTYNRALAAEEIDALYLTHDVRQGKELQFTVNAVNAQGIPIVYQASAMPAGASFDAATQSVRWTPWHNQLGLFSFRFTSTGQPEKVVNVEVHPSSMTSWYTLGQGQLTKVR